MNISLILTARRQRHRTVNAMQVPLQEINCSLPKRKKVVIAFSRSRSRTAAKMAFSIGFFPELIPYGWGQDGDDGDDEGDGGGGGSSDRLKPSYRETAEMASSRGGAFLTSADRWV